MNSALASPPSSPGSFVPTWRRGHRPVGSQKGYNFSLWCIFAVGALAFTLSRAEYLDYYGVFCKKNHLSRGHHAAPGECYYFLNGGREQIGMMIHIYSIIPCCILQFFQFVPIVRQRFVLFHRINGHAVIILLSIAIVGVLMALPGSFGGDPTWQAAVMIHTAMMVTGLFLAMTNIKRLQIEQHRAWMLRTWIWAFSIITMRIIQQIVVCIISKKGYASTRPCAQIMSDGVLLASAVENIWPDCAAYFSGENIDQTALVVANYFGLPIEINVALSMASGLSAFMALLLHVIGAEIYLHLTPDEAERLRNISYYKQLAAGMAHPGHAGLSVGRFGDAAEWCHRHDGKMKLDSDGMSIISDICRK